MPLCLNSFCLLSHRRHCRHRPASICFKSIDFLFGDDRHTFSLWLFLLSYSNLKRTVHKSTIIINLWNGYIGSAQFETIIMVHSARLFTSCAQTLEHTHTQQTERENKNICFSVAQTWAKEENKKPADILYNSKYSYDSVDWVSRKEWKKWCDGIVPSMDKQSCQMENWLLCWMLTHEWMQWIIKQME